MLILDVLQGLEAVTPPPERQINALEWCTCNNCVPMPTSRERVCCGLPPQNCMSRRPVSYITTYNFALIICNFIYVVTCSWLFFLPYGWLLSSCAINSFSRISSSAGGDVSLHHSPRPKKISTPSTKKIDASSPNSNRCKISGLCIIIIMIIVYDHFQI